MKTIFAHPLRALAIGLLVLIVAFFVANSFSQHSPTVDILGSYFPAWMVCILVGLMLTLTARWTVKASHLEPYLGPAPLIYSGLMIIFTFATWIIFYRN